MLFKTGFTFGEAPFLIRFASSLTYVMRVFTSSSPLGSALLTPVAELEAVWMPCVLVLGVSRTKGWRQQSCTVHQ